MEKTTQNDVPNIKSAKELREVREDDIGAKSRISALFDEGTFAEVGAFAHKIAPEFASDKSELEGVICGYGAIDGRLAFAFLQDFSRNKGAVGAMHAKKICELYDLAVRNGAPIIGVFDSAGAYVMEGVEALAGYGKIMKKVASASGVIPQIAVIAGNCGGAMATVASMFDIVVGAKDGGSLYVNSPFIVNELEKTDEFGKIETAAKNGQIHTVCENDVEALAYVRRFLAYIPQNCQDGTAYFSSSDEINRLTLDVSQIISSENYDMTSVVKAICDNADFFELSSMHAKSMLTGFITLNGMVVGVVANNPAHKNGKVTPCGAKKAARFISFCDCFNVPLLTLVDTEGYEVSATAEKGNYGSALAKLASAYAMSDMAKVTVVLGKAYGAAYTLMGSKSIGADIVFASETSKISAMPTKTAVAFLWNDKVTESSKRKEVEEKWDAVMASPVVAAKSGEVDDIINLDELRKRTSSAFEMLSAKNSLCLNKKHGNLPL